MKFSDLKFNRFGMIEIGRCKGRVPLAKHFDSVPYPDFAKPMKVTIEAEISGVWGRFDGTGQEFTIEISKVTKGWKS